MLKLKSVMRTQVHSIGPEVSLMEAARKMKSLGIGVLPVCEADHVIGLITDRDIVVRSMAEEGDPKLTLARDVMSRDLVTCSEDDHLFGALKKMREHKIGRLVIVDRAGGLKGLVTLGDLTRRLGKKNLVSRRRPLLIGFGAMAGAFVIFVGARFVRGKWKAFEHDIDRLSEEQWDVA